jgi:hypothetical protein
MRICPTLVTVPEGHNVRAISTLAIVGIIIIGEAQA